MMSWNIERRESRYDGENDIIFLVHDKQRLTPTQKDYFYFERVPNAAKLVRVKDHEGFVEPVDAAEQLIRWSSNLTKVLDKDGDVLVELVRKGDQ